MDTAHDLHDAPASQATREPESRAIAQRTLEAPIGRIFNLNAKQNCKHFHRFSSSVSAIARAGVPRDRATGTSGLSLPGLPMKPADLDRARAHMVTAPPARTPRRVRAAPRPSLCTGAAIEARRGAPRR